MPDDRTARFVWEPGDITLDDPDVTDHLILDHGSKNAPSSDAGDDEEAQKALISMPDADYIPPASEKNWKHVQETVPADAPDEDFAFPEEKKLYIGDDAHLAMAITALAPGGFRGRKVEIPTSKKSKAISRIRAKINSLKDEGQKKHLLERLRNAVHETVREEVNIPYSMQFKGNPPSVRTFPDVDLPALVDGDTETRKFITLPIAKVGAVSENGLLYDKELVGAIFSQIQNQRPAGLQGHIPEKDKGTSFPLPVGIWIGAQMVGDTLWAKSYLFPGPFREYVKGVSAARGTLATSIYGDGLYEPVTGNTKRCIDFQLQTIDFAPAERASLVVGDGKQFSLTAEMVSDGKNKKQGIKEMGASAPDVDQLHPNDVESSIENWDKDQLMAHGKKVAECMAGKGNLGEFFGHVAGKMKASEIAQHMPDGMRSDVHEALGAAAVENPAEAAMSVNDHDEDDKKSGVHEMKNLYEASIAEMQAKLKSFEQEKFEGVVNSEIDSLIPWTVSQPQHKERVASLKNVIKRQIVQEMAGGMDVTLLKTTAQKVFTENKSLVEGVHTSITGPTAFTVGGRVDDTQLATKEAADRARSNLGL